LTEIHTPAPSKITMITIGNDHRTSLLFYPVIFYP
jgi:hypothetical protein